MNTSRLIVGLGNPGAEYRDTRHNAGFMLVDRLAERWGCGWRMEKKFFAEVAEGRQAGGRVLLAKPQTFINLSGKAVAELVQFYKVGTADVLVALDDADLPLGTLRLRPEGSPGGHHGLESVEQHLGSRAYARLKLGIARPASEARDIAGHVLGRFSREEHLLWEKVLQRAVEQVECWTTEGIAKAMNRFNGSVTADPKSSGNAERKTQ